MKKVTTLTSRHLMGFQFLINRQSQLNYLCNGHPMSDFLQFVIAHGAFVGHLLSDSYVIFTPIA